MKFRILLSALLFPAILFLSEPRLLDGFWALAPVPAPYVKEAEEVRIELKLLKEQRDNIQKETMPPYRDTPQRRMFALDQIKYVRSCVGTLPDNQSIREMGSRKYSPYHVNGFAKSRHHPSKKGLSIRSAEDCMFSESGVVINHRPAGQQDRS